MMMMMMRQKEKGEREEEEEEEKDWKEIEWTGKKKKKIAKDVMMLMTKERNQKESEEEKDWAVEAAQEGISIEMLMWTCYEKERKRKKNLSEGKEEMRREQETWV